MGGNFRDCGIVVRKPFNLKATSKATLTVRHEPHSAPHAYVWTHLCEGSKLPNLFGHGHRLTHPRTHQYKFWKVYSYAYIYAYNPTPSSPSYAYILLLICFASYMCNQPINPLNWSVRLTWLFSESQWSNLVPSITLIFSNMNLPVVAWYAYAYSFYLCL